jgi:uncharacterized membrane protein
MIFKENSLHQKKDTGMACILICLIGFLLGGQHAWVIAALFFLLLNMIRPQLYTPLAVIWFGLSHKLGSIVSTMLLTVLFYIVVTPIALIRKMTGADAMRQKQWRQSDSAFSVRNHSFSASDLEKPY